MASLINWLDHSEADQRRVREVLRLFSQSDTVDDLGIGTIRDAISNALFPGTSVIQTRARYFLFVPWIFRRAEQRYPKRLVAKANDMERSLIGALREGGDRNGLIGVDAGTNVRTLPSAIFWGGLARHGIFLAPSLSIRQYGRQAARRLALPDDVEGEMGDRAPSFWQREIPDPPEDFFDFEHADFDLTGAEAEWLRERIIAADSSPGGQSLLATLVQTPGQASHLAGAENVWEVELPSATPDEARHLVHHAERFSCAMHGAALLYNLLLAKKRSAAGLETSGDTDPADYRERLSSWTADARRVRLARWSRSITEFHECLLRFGAHIPHTTMKFVDDWAAFLANDYVHVASSADARHLIRDREFAHKRGQARLVNNKRLTAWNGNAGTTPLAYRWPQVRRMLNDLNDGLRKTGSLNADVVT